MGYLAHLKRQPHCEDCRWIVKYDTKELIREVKLVYKPSEYSRANAKRYGNKARKLHKRDELILLLELDRSKRSG
tara:strand:+ start:737 stop:961 length:225 start_codon:yes stop_codon:yes gene_type:complete